MKLSPFFLFASLTALVPVAAHAADPEKTEPKANDPAHLTSLELTLRPTLGSAGGSSLVQLSPSVQGNRSSILAGTAAPYGAMFGIGGEVGFRFHPLVSAGLRADFAKISATAPNDGTTDLSRSRVSAGLYARVYPLGLNESLRRRFDPWVATGALYLHDAQSFHAPAATNVGTTVDAQVDLVSHDVGVPLGVGFDYRITPAISVGPSFEYTFLVPIAGCATQSAAGFSANELCSGGSSASSKSVLAESTGAWTAGIDLRFTPF